MRLLPSVKMGVQKYLELQASTGSYGKYYGFFLTLVREFK